MYVREMLHLLYGIVFFLKCVCLCFLGLRLVEIKVK